MEGCRLFRKDGEGRQGGDATQRDLDRLEGWARVNLIKFNTAKCKVLLTGQGNTKHKYRLRGKWIESSPEEKDFTMLVDEKLHVTQQCVLVTQKANCIPPPALELPT